MKKGLLDQFGTPGEEEGQFKVERDNQEPFMKEMNDLISIEHDLETEKLAFPSKLEDGFSAADLNIMEMFFDLSELENKPEKEDEPKKSSDNED